MPYLIDRRSFLRSTAFQVGALTLPIAMTQAQEASSVRWAFISDTHVPGDPSNEYRGFKPYAQFKETVQSVVDAKPEGAIITGDLARLEGFDSDYAAMKSLIDPMTSAMPVGLALGNHDHRDNFKRAFSKSSGVNPPISGKHVTILETAVTRFIVLDSLLYTNKVAGYLGKAQRTWIKEYLAQPSDKPIFFFFHHPPVEGDGSLLDYEQLLRTILPVKQVKAVIFGHSHVYAIREIDGIQFINLPAVAYNFNDNEPTGWIEAVITAEGGEFTLHALGGNTDKNGTKTSLKWRPSS